jgi:hypothetical protein
MNFWQECKHHRAGTCDIEVNAAKQAKAAQQQYLADLKAVAGQLETGVARLRDEQAVRTEEVSELDRRKEALHAELRKARQDLAGVK